MRNTSYKRLAIITLLTVHILLGIILSSCKTNTVYVPIETVRTEYKDKLSRDSIYLHDSIFIKRRNDTVWLEKYRYLYRDKRVQDSIFITDSIQVPYPVKGDTKYTNHLYWWQQLLIVLGGISLGMIIYKVYCYLKR